MNHDPKLNRATSDPEAHAQAMVDADDNEPGPDHWTRDDIDAAVGALCSIADDMRQIATFTETVLKQAGANSPNNGR